VEARALLPLLEDKVEISVRRAAVLALGELNSDRLPTAERDLLAPRLVELYRQGPDPGLHAAVGWLLWEWGQKEKVAAVDAELAGKGWLERRWYVNSQKQTMVILQEPGVFWMGGGKGRHQWKIARSFAVAAHEVTVEQFRRFRKDHKPVAQYAPTDDCPVNNVSWYDAVAYCNWLSKQDGIPEEEWCYPSEEDIEKSLKEKKSLRMPKDYLHRKGYRLPTEAEWEYACRARSDTDWAHGDAEELLGKYAWYYVNSGGKSHPVGTRRPNDFGLFDMHGNDWEWCQDWYRDLKVKKDEVVEDKEDTKDI
jgi:formylglycine-generating enzyme required for sulfatase activity